MTPKGINIKQARENMDERKIRAKSLKKATERSFNKKYLCQSRFFLRKHKIVFNISSMKEWGGDGALQMKKMETETYIQKEFPTLISPLMKNIIPNN